MTQQQLQQLVKTAHSRYLTALMRTPMQWNNQQPWHQNLLNHLQSVYRMGSDAINRQYEGDRMIQNLSLPYRYQRLGETIEGLDPVVTNPLDNVLYHGPSYFR